MSDLLERLEWDPDSPWQEILWIVTNEEDADDGARVSVPLGELRRILAHLRQHPGATYEHPEHGLTCHVGGCSLEVVTGDEGTSHYAVTECPTLRQGEPDGYIKSRVTTPAGLSVQVSVKKHPDVGAPVYIGRKP